MDAQQARITWNTGGPVHVSSIRERDLNREDRFSDGACYLLWRNADPDKMLDLLLELFARLTLVHGCDPARVDDVFAVITQWNRWRSDTDDGRKG